ncbi:unannotated protein [freshwater metagenome]|uniref:Unannotated protein n=1 Tax=freshwater metagenome TaxID=449393 RepID=A0A6J6GAM3_9ZZZZ
MAILDEVTRFSSATESERLQLKEHDGTEVLVDHCDVNVCGGDSGLAIKLFTENATFGVLAKIFVVIGKHFVSTLELDGRGPKDWNSIRTMVSGSLSSCNQQSDTAVGFEATVQLAEDRFDDPAGVLMVLKRDRAFEELRIRIC